MPSRCYLYPSRPIVQLSALEHFRDVVTAQRVAHLQKYTQFHAAVKPHLHCFKRSFVALPAELSLEAERHRHTPLIMKEALDASVHTDNDGANTEEEHKTATDDSSTELANDYIVSIADDLDVDVSSADDENVL